MRGNGVPLANDTSFGVGFAPLSTVERIVSATARYLNSEAYKRKMPGVGDDIKVMGLKDGNKITLTIAIAFVARYIHSMDEYISYKEKVEHDVAVLARKFTNKEVDIVVNHGDSIEKGEVYLTKSGLSCEAGDDGSVGRGNRVNGLITPFRYMSLEAAAGKNPVSHVGKIYNILATKLAGLVVEEVPSVKECHIAMLSQIGRKIDDPKSLSISLIAEKPSSFDAAAKKAKYLAEGALEATGRLTSDIVLGKYSVF
jgi:S-adenosylmethionine synthetase